jgi:hypothetical protein
MFRVRFHDGDSSTTLGWDRQKLQLDVCIYYEVRKNKRADPSGLPRFIMLL